MVKMAAGVVNFCGTLLLLLPSVSSVQPLNTLNDLKLIGFGEAVSKQALVLLHWFANTVDIDNDVIRLTFDPNSDFGSHHYGNYEGLLNKLNSNRYCYYTVGNILEDTERQLPSHILNPRTPELRGNSARIIVRVRDPNVRWQGTRQVIDEVYITQHHGQGTLYDPQHTYRITTNLLRQIRQFPMRGDYNSLRNLRDLYGPNVQDNQLQNIRHQWNDLACLGLLLLIVVPHIRFNNQSHTVLQQSSLQSNWSQPQRDTSGFCECIKNCLLVVVFLLIMLIIFGALANRNKY